MAEADNEQDDQQPRARRLTIGRRVAAAADLAAFAVHESAGRYIPVRDTALAHAIAEDAERFGPTAAVVSELMPAITRVIDQETSAFRNRISHRYEVFNPDRETVALADEDSELTPAAYDALENRLHHLLEKANYERLSDAQINKAIEMASSHGLSIVLEPERVERFNVYVRGRRFETVKVKHRWRLRKEERKVEVYRRLAVVFQLKGEPHINLKLFREIQVNDLESLFPHARVTMNGWDRLKIVGGGLGALGGVARQVSKIVLGGAVAATQFLWVVIAALFTLSFRSFFGYRGAKLVRTGQMTHNLYFKNVANNAAVIHSLVHAIFEEEVKEALLAYAFLSHVPEGKKPIASPGQLRAEIEPWLMEDFGVAVRFDAPDAMEKLARLQLWEDRDAWKVLSPEQAVKRLGDHFVGSHTSDYHESVVARHEGDEADEDPGALSGPSPVRDMDAAS